MMFMSSSTGIKHVIMIQKKTWLPLAIVVSDWLKLQVQLIYNLVKHNIMSNTPSHGPE